MSATLQQLEKLLEAVGDPEYRFLLLEPMILYGILFGLVAFAAAFFLRQERLQQAALVVIALSALAILPYIGARTAAQPRMEQVYQISSPTRVAAFRSNTATWKDQAWVFYALAGLASGTLLIGSRRNRLGAALALATVGFSAMGMKDALWLHYQDSLAYHPNLKQHQAPVTAAAADSGSAAGDKRASPAPVSRPAPAPLRQTRSVANQAAVPAAQKPAASPVPTTQTKPAPTASNANESAKPKFRPLSFLRPNQSSQPQQRAAPQQRPASQQRAAPQGPPKPASTASANRPAPQPQQPGQAAGPGRLLKPLNIFKPDQSTPPPPGNQAPQAAPPKTRPLSLGIGKTKPLPATMPPVPIDPAIPPHPVQRISRPIPPPAP